MRSSSFEPDRPCAAACGAARWATSSYGDSADTRPAELEALRQHLGQCSACDPRLAALRCGGLRLLALVNSHQVTTVALAAVVTAALLLL
ncbi:hypothetical protein IWX58_000728 [Rubrivivax gelatinosus]|uniref:hypothetical protein n=1 Tax=Rubrivivax gelatinosus TaxID=28068 RepID=UPI0018CB8400|nr:hypothetical protein [Rubrivivax gelatinosus]MBG6079041.1 hypothetical protein [Rubrivivax gelatinosus]